MTTKYDNKILEICSNWRHTNNIVSKVEGDKSAVIQSLKRLVDMDFLEVKPNSNKLLYKRKDTAQKEFDFMMMMKVMENNQKQELHNLSQFSTILMKDGKRLRQKSLYVLEHINEEVNRAYMVKVRLDYQKNLEIITSDIADNRTKMLDDYIEKIMSTVMNKNQDDKTRKAIQEYFQNHTTKLEFKI